MSGFWIAAKDVPPDGWTYTLDEPGIWAEPIAEFGLPVKIGKPLIATVFLLAQDNGFLVRGKLRGAVILPCSRCAEDSATPIEHEFESFELFPGAFGEEGEEVDAGLDAEQDASVVRNSPYGPEIDLAALLWQELLLVLPVKALCSAACKGLCPKCGENLNLKACACAPEEGDPRLATLRGVRIQR